MLQKFLRAPLKIKACFLAGLVGLLYLGIGCYRNYFNPEKQPYKIGVIINSVEVTPEDLKAVKFLVDQKLQSINAEGGINEHPAEVFYLDDKGSEKLLYNLVQHTIRDRNVVAYIGCKSSSRAKAIAPLLTTENVALIGGYSLTPIMEKYPNMYSGEIGIKDVSVVLQEVLKNKATKAAFIGKTGDLYSNGLLQEMETRQIQNPKFKVVYKGWFPQGYKFSKHELDEMAENIKATSNFLLLSTEQGSTNYLLNEFWKRGVRIPVFCGLADISQIDSRNKFYYSSELFDINPVGIPGVLNMRLQEQITRYKEQLKPGTTFEFQLGFGGRHADELGLLKEAAQDKSVPENADIRAKINAGLKKYINGNQVYRGWYADWYFTPDRSFAGEAILSWKPRNFNQPILAPLQFHRTETGMLPKPDLPVLYTNIDIEEISQENDEEGTFNATFYLEINSAKNISFEYIDFTNAARNKVNQEPLIEAKLIRSKKDTLPEPFYNYLYKVSGKFFFEPDLKQYPFDEQKFPITLQSNNALQTFLVQPPAQELRDTAFTSSGWIYQHNYVGYDQDIVTSDNNFSSLQKNIPYYKFSFVYVLKRARIDFSLKILVPLLAILIITYFSVYIPRKEFEALCGIQVTALLAAIALYFSTYKPEMQYATVSDKIFIFTYIMITSLIGTSVYLYVRYHDKRFITSLARIYQRIVFPLIVIVFTLFIKY